ncbi:uncharacterized protein F4807DRAFT_434082 [Annulohypoxylon truncatum]|uniref:uncharacterized protein n=1 Tax=Annulohypoxylon truncatum TaxID=327061 RepID=UPI002008292E|nr:uncharacterized protein F4807DRAFT_434082 [Annulohypoxylon truncatum]KAI1207661.1 hypothetical protein F4807DRAFT_434082 [Annulohypoxylon truncatum]
MVTRTRFVVPTWDIISLKIKEILVHGISSKDEYKIKTAGEILRKTNAIHKNVKRYRHFLEDVQQHGPVAIALCAILVGSKASRSLKNEDFSRVSREFEGKDKELTRLLPVFQSCAEKHGLLSPSNGMHLGCVASNSLNVNMSLLAPPPSHSNTVLGTLWVCTFAVELFTNSLHLEAPAEIQNISFSWRSTIEPYDYVSEPIDCGHILEVHLSAKRAKEIYPVHHELGSNSTQPTRRWRPHNDSAFQR